jgi:predicted dehydrogenase
MNTIINVAVVGCGYWGPNLIRNFISLPDCKVKTVCDLDTERLAHMKQLYPSIHTTTRFDEVIQDNEIDAVAIATPVQSHFKLAQACLRVDKHVYIEKPMAASARECQQLNDISEKKGLTLIVGHTFIYSAPVRTVKEIVDSGYLGDIYYINTQRLNLGLFQKDINVAWDLAPHDLSIILYLIDESPKSVNCLGESHVNEAVEDVTTMTLGFSHRKFAIIQSSWLDPNKVRRMTIIGSKRMLVYDDTQPLEKIKIYDKRVEVPPHYDSYAEFHYSYHYGDMHAPYIKQTEPLKVLCEHFLECIQTGTKPESSGLEGLQVVQILEAASASLKNAGARVKIVSGDRVTEEPYLFEDALETEAVQV